MKMIATTLLIATSVAFAQTPTAPAPPVPPVMLSYHYWPEQFVQWLGPDMPYSMVEFVVDQNGGKPLMELSLTDKTTQKRVHYTNDESVAAGERANGDETYVTKLAIDRPEAAGKDATYTIRAVLKDNLPLQWRFVQGSDLMQQGGGMNPLPQIPVPVFAYRELGAVAGEGTAISIGKQVDVAELWKEISRPPYFVAYRGAYSSGATTLVFAAGKEMWKIDASPAKVEKGSVWKLSTEGGRQRTLTVASIDVGHATITDVDSAFQHTQRTILATWSDGSWKFEGLRFVPSEGEKHSLAINISQSALEVVLGKKNKIASASCEMGPSSSAITIASPDWAKGKSMVARTTIENGSFTLGARPRTTDK